MIWTETEFFARIHSIDFFCSALSCLQATRKLGARHGNVLQFRGLSETILNIIEEKLSN